MSNIAIVLDFNLAYHNLLCLLWHKDTYKCVHRTGNSLLKLPRGRMTLTVQVPTHSSNNTAVSPAST